MSNKPFVASCISFLLLTGAFLVCTPAQKLDRMINKKSGGIEAVQIHFREGLLDPDLAREAEERLAKNIPYKVIPSSETTNDRMVLKIIVDSIEKDKIEEWGYGKIWFASAGYSLPYMLNPVSLLFVPIIATFVTNSAYKDINNFKEKFGSLPLNFNTFITVDNEIVFDDSVFNKYQRFPNNDTNFTFIERNAIRHLMQPEYTNTDILKLSLDIWLDTVTYLLNDHYTTSRGKPVG